MRLFVLPGELVIWLINRGRCTGSHGAVYQLRRQPKKEIMCYGGWVKCRRRGYPTELAERVSIG